MSQQASHGSNSASYEFATGVLIQQIGAHSSDSGPEVLIFDPKEKNTHLVSGALAELVMRISDSEDKLASLTQVEESLLQTLIDSGLVVGFSLSPASLSLSRRSVLLAGTGLALSIALPTPTAADSSFCRAIGCPADIGANAFRCNCNNGASGVLCSTRACNDPLIANAHQQFCQFRGGTASLECCPC